MSFAARVLSHRAFRRRHLIGLVVLITFALWSLLWGVTAITFNRAISRWIELAKTNGTIIEYSHRYTNGSPFAIHTHLDGISIKTKTGSSIRAGESVFYLDLVDWDSVSIKLRKGIDGVLGSTPFTAAGLKVGFTVPETSPTTHSETGFSFWIHPFVLTFKTPEPVPFGNTLEEGMLNVRIMGDVPDFSNKESLKAWNEAGGVIEFDRIYLNWRPMIITGSGTMGFDPMLQPEGAFSGRIEGIEAAIDNLVQKGAIDKRQESLLNSSLHVLSRPSGLTGSSAPIVPMSIQSGGLYLGPVKLLAIPKIEWD